MPDDNDVDPDHSVTCLCCGELADERETVPITDDLDELGHDMPAVFPLRFGAIMKLVNDEGRGEAHMDCFEEYLQKYGVDQILQFHQSHDITEGDN